MNDITKEYHLIKSQIHYKENNNVKVRKVTKVHKVKAELESLEVGEFIVKSDIIIRYWKGSWIDVFIIRSFDVAFHKAKALMPEKKFKTKSGLIERIL